MKFDKNMILLYAITERSLIGKQSLYEKIDEALRGGVTIVQLREKNLPEDEFINEAVKVKKLCNKYNVPLIINDNFNVALKSGADGVHVGIEDMSIEEIRSKAPEGFIVGATAKTVKQAQCAERDGADYLGVGSVFSSPTKKNAVRITVEQLKEISCSVSIPSVAIGGITADNASLLSSSSICGIAVVSSIFGTDNVYNATRNLKKIAKDITEL